MTMRSCIAIFAKYPVRGRVKTRLSPPLTPDEVTELYRAFLLDTIHLIGHIEGIEPAILFTPDMAHGDFRALARLDAAASERTAPSSAEPVSNPTALE